MATDSNKDSQLSTILNKGVESREYLFWPPKVVWAREMGWLRVRDPWGKWHEIPAKEAPSGYQRLAMKAKGR